MKNIEHQLQVACVRWFRMQHPSVLIFAIPNGGQRNVITAKRLKDEGVVAGVADLFIVYANKFGYNGLFVEMKTDKGRQTESQKEFERYCVTHNYKYEVCRSFDEFVKVCNEYV